MATPTRSPEVPARKPGTCGWCGERIVPFGEHYIVKVDGAKQGWMHAACADEYRRARDAADEIFEEHDTDGADGAREES